MPNPNTVRANIVEALIEATTDDSISDEHVAEIIYNATPAERALAADVHARLAELTSARASTLAAALQILAPWFRVGMTLGAVLKTAPPERVQYALTILRSGGWTEADGLPSAD